MIRGALFGLLGMAIGLCVGQIITGDIQKSMATAVIAAVVYIVMEWSKK